MARMNQAASAVNSERSPSTGHRTQLKPVANQSGTRWRNGRRVYEYQTGSWWSHLLFGLGMLAFMAVPPLIPGMTANALIKGYIGFLAVCYGVICVWGIMRSFSQQHGGSAVSHRRGKT